jgi:hypothetical protein
MRTGKHTLTRIIVVALAGLAIGIPTAQASGQSPDSRPYYRGTDPALAPRSPSPDDRAFSRGIPASSKTILVSPDDRAFSRGIPVSSKTIIVSPDDRSFVRSTPVQPRTLVTSVSVQPRGFDWGDALIGGTFGLIVALLGAGAVAITLHHRRDVLRTA